MTPATLTSLLGDAAVSGHDESARPDGGPNQTRGHMDNGLRPADTDYPSLPKYYLDSFTVVFGLAFPCLAVT